MLINFFINHFSKTFGKTFTKISQRALDDLCDYHFPGNIRELKHIIERAFTFSKEPLLNLYAGFELNTNVVDASNAFLSLEEINRRHIIEALKKCKGKICGANSASKLLVVNEKTLYSRIRKLDIDVAKIKLELKSN